MNALRVAVSLSMGIFQRTMEVIAAWTPFTPHTVYAIFVALFFVGFCVAVYYHNKKVYDEVVRETPNIDLLRRYVHDGGVIMSKPLFSGAMNPALHCAILKGQLEVMKVLLESPGDIDLTVRGVCGNTPLHCICYDFGVPRSLTQMKKMTSAILQRLEVHPKDHVNWGMKNADGHDFLSLAAKESVLSYLYPLVKHQDYYRTTPRPFVLTAKPTSMADWEADWGRFSESGQALFRLAWE